MANTVSISYNPASVQAQFNARVANNKIAHSASALSSGSKIVDSMDDAAGLAIAENLKASITQSRAANDSIAQGRAATNIADGGLKNIGALLQRQLALATQATSGVYTSVTRGYLNEEFQRDVLEIDREATSTAFNGINLIDGSLFAPSKLTTDSGAKLATSVSGNMTFVSTTLADYDTKTVDINGATLTYQSTAGLGTGLNVDISAATTAADIADATYNKIQEVLNYQGTDTTTLAAKANLAGLSFTHTAATAGINVASTAGGAEFNSGGGSAITITGALTAAGDMTVNGTDAGIAAVDLSAGGIAGVDGDLSAGTFGTSGTATTIAMGSISDSILVDLDKNAGAAAMGTGFETGIATHGISNNAAFVGKIQGFKASYESDDYVNLSVTVGDHTYQATGVKTTNAADTVVRFSSENGQGGFFDLDFASGGTTTAVTNQVGANSFAARIDKALSGVDIYQNRKIASYDGVGSVYPSGSSTPSGNLSGSSFQLLSNNFVNLNVEDVKVTAPVAGGSNAVIEVMIGGEKFVSGYDDAGASSALGTSVAANAKIGLVSEKDPNKRLIFTNSGTTLNFATALQAQGLQEALENAFGVGAGGASNGGLTFQVGAAASDSINLQIKGARTEDLYIGSDGASKKLDVSTLAGAQEAVEVLQNAINNINGARATIGAAQAQFKYASDQIQISIQNQDAARSVFEDADMLEESATFMKNKVLNDAAIAMLAQVNQLPNNLLQLLR